MKDDEDTSELTSWFWIVIGIVILVIMVTID